jgi:KUP system potassium uptake protein
MPDTTAPHTATAQAAPSLGTTAGQNLTIAALGVVYGDIGTSPLYAIKQCFHDGSAVTAPRVFGVLS